MKIFKLIFVCLLLCSNVTYAQFGALKKLGDLGESDSEAEDTSSSSSVSAEESQEALVATFKETMTLIITAQSRLQEAVGNSKDAQALQLVIDDLNGECAKECVARTVEASKSASEEINENLATQEALGAEKAEIYMTAIPLYIQGTLKAKDLAATASDWSKQSLTEIKDAGLMGAGKLKAKLETGTFVASQMPSLLSSWGQSTQMVLTFAKSNDMNLDSVEGVNDFDF